MNKILSTIAVVLSCMSMMAEDHIQVVPFTTETGVTSDDCEPFSMEMVNTNAYTALQFHLILPEGITLDMDYPFDMNADRFPGVTKRGNFTPNHDYDITNPATGDYFIKIYNTKLETISGSEGEILSFYYNVASDMKPGYYQIRVSGAILGIDSHNGVSPETSVSWVKVGDPGENALLDLGDYAIPSFVAAKMPEKNVIVDGVCANLQLTDGSDFIVSADFTATSATYTRSVTNSFGTVCLPYEVQSTDVVQYYQLKAVDTEKMTFEPVETIAAGIPALFRLLSGTTATMTAQDVSVSSTDKTWSETLDGTPWTMKGTFAATALDPSTVDDDIYYISENKFWYANQTFDIPAFRGWFETAKSSGVKMLAIEALDDETTGIKYVENADGTVDVVYDLAGRRLQTVKEGVNIINGKKILKK